MCSPPAIITTAPTWHWLEVQPEVVVRPEPMPAPADRAAPPRAREARPVQAARRRPVRAARRRVAVARRLVKVARPAAVPAVRWRVRVARRAVARTAALMAEQDPLATDADALSEAALGGLERLRPRGTPRATPSPSRELTHTHDDSRRGSNDRKKILSTNVFVSGAQTEGTLAWEACLPSAQAAGQSIRGSTPFADRSACTHPRGLLAVHRRPQASGCPRERGRAPRRPSQMGC